MQRRNLLLHIVALLILVAWVGFPGPAVAQDRSNRARGDVFTSGSQGPCREHPPYDCRCPVRQKGALEVENKRHQGAVVYFQSALERAKRTLTTRTSLAKSKQESRLAQKGYDEEVKKWTDALREEERFHACRVDGIQKGCPSGWERDCQPRPPGNEGGQSPRRSPTRADETKADPKPHPVQNCKNATGYVIPRVVSRLGGVAFNTTARQQIEVGRLLKYEGANLPRLRRGSIVAVGKSTICFNCFGYAADQRNPPGWVDNGGPVQKGAEKMGARGITAAATQEELFKFYDEHGWGPPIYFTQVTSDGQQPKPGELWIVLYATKGTTSWAPQHAAIWTADAVYAKMGEFGTFRFDSLDQMTGGKFGEPWVVLKRKP